MDILVIPDCHLKPQLFGQASALMKSQNITQAVCLMDIADDWGQENNLDLYRDTYDAAIDFAKAHPETLWCYGNHDISYLWDRSESGFSPLAQPVVREKLFELMNSLPDPRQLAFLHRIDDILFSHGGLSYHFVQRFVPMRYHDDIDEVLTIINGFGPQEMWQLFSPLWLRPQFTFDRMFRPRKFLQVVGHTPVKSITKKRNIISCDVFSTHRNGKPYGSSEFLVIDSRSREFRCVEPLSE